MPTRSTPSANAATGPKTATTAKTAHSPTTAKAARKGPAQALPINEVHLQGRLSGRPESRALPSGDEVLTFRLVIARPGPRPSVDTIDCAIWKAGLRHRVGRWNNGDQIEVIGALRRRFWRPGAAVASRCEVEVSSARRRLRAPGHVT